MLSAVASSNMISIEPRVNNDVELLIATIVTYDLSEVWCGLRMADGLSFFFEDNVYTQSLIHTFLCNDILSSLSCMP